MAIHIISLLKAHFDENERPSDNNDMLATGLRRIERI